MVHFLFSLMSSVPFGSVNVFYIIPDKKPFVKPAFLVKCEQLPFIKLLFFSKISNFKASYGKFVSGFSKKRTAFSLEPWKTLDFTDINLLLEVLSSGCAKLLKSDQFHGLNAQTFFLVQKNRKIALFQGIFGTCFCAGRHNSKWFL